MAPLRILIGDDHRLVREALRRLLEDRPGWQVVAEAKDGQETVRMAAELRPDVAIVDITMPAMNGIEAIRQIALTVPSVRSLVLSMHSDDSVIRQAVEAGARGYLVKSCADADLVLAIKEVAAGRCYFSPTVARIVLDDYLRRMQAHAGGDRFDALSQREREIFQLVAEGHSNQRIAEFLSIRPTTVETHRARVFRKLDIHSAAELVLCAVRRGLIA